MARPQTIYSYLPDHNQIADEFIELLNKKLTNQDKNVTLDNFDQDLKLLALECKFNYKFYNIILFYIFYI